jgi:hypothetical protein
MATERNEVTSGAERVRGTLIGEAVGRIGALLRYVAPGVLALFVWAVVVEKKADGGGAIAGGGYSMWALAAVAAVCGFLIYAMHVCFVGRVFWRPLILQMHLGKEQHRWISAEQRKAAKAGLDGLLLELSVSRLQRRVSDDAEVRAVQEGLDKWAAMLNFLYCSSYAMIVVPLLVMCPKTEVTESAWADFVIILGVVCLVAALASDHMRVWRDLWAAATYPGAKAPRARRRGRKETVVVP